MRLLVKRNSWLLLLPLLLSCRLLLGQAAPAVAESAAPPAVPSAVLPADTGAVLLFNDWYLPAYRPGSAAADTTGALLSLFRKRRYAGWLYALPFIAGMSLALPISSTDANGQTTVAAEAISPPAGVGILGATLVGFVLHASAFNKAHLRAVDQAYAAGQPIPARYRRQLNSTHFAEAAFLREALSQQMARERLARPNSP